MTKYLMAGMCGSQAAEKEREKKRPESQYPHHGHASNGFTPPLNIHSSKYFTTSQ
jgi:hypothetical protein